MPTANRVPRAKLGQLLLEYRAEHHLTQDEVGKELGISGSAVSRIEQGGRMPFPTTEINIRKLLKIKN